MPEVTADAARHAAAQAFAAWRRGWTAGAGCHSYQPEDAGGGLTAHYEDGYTAGRQAFRAAMEERRREVGLPPGMVVRIAGSFVLDTDTAGAGVTDGERVGAIFGAEGRVLKVLGYGVYEGSHVPDESARGFAELAREANCPNPRIRLDNGDVVWGGECWWGSEEKVRARIQKHEAAGYTVLEVRIADERAAARARQEERKV